MPRQRRRRKRRSAARKKMPQADRKHPAQIQETMCRNYQERGVIHRPAERTKILAAKQEVIAEVLEKARAKVEAMEAGEYFSMLLKMVEKYALAQDGEICLCAADLARLPEGFEAEVSRIGKGKGRKP